MININLLPPELQRAARTPRAVFFSLIGGVAVTMLVGVGALMLWMNVRSVEREVESRQLQVRVLEEEASEVDRLNEDIAFYKDRENAIIEIKSRRTFWGLKLYQLMSLTPRDMWVTRLNMSTLDEADYKWDSEQTGGELTLDCYAKGTEVQTITDYRSALAGSKSISRGLIVDDSVFPDNFFGDFLGYAPISFERVTLEGYEEPRSLHSEVKVALKPRFDKPQEDPKGKK